MDMSSLNISATLNIFRLIAKPNLCLPQATVSTFNHLPIPLNSAFAKYEKDGRKKVDIRAVVLDKDNCFAIPHENQVYKPYEEHFSNLKKAYPGRKLLIVSNTAGSSSDPSLSLSESVQTSTGIHVLSHPTKKPGCGNEVMEYFKKYPETGVERPEHVAIVGDRLSTDVLMANLMGAWGVWVKDGIVPVEEVSVFARMEQKFASFLLKRGYEAPDPSSPFEK